MELPADAGQVARYASVSRKLALVSQISDVVELIKSFKTDVDESLRALVAASLAGPSHQTDDKLGAPEEFAKLKEHLTRATEKMSKIEQFPLLPSKTFPSGPDDNNERANQVTESRLKRKRDEEVLASSISQLKSEIINRRFEGIESDHSCRLKRRKICVASVDAMDDYIPSDGVPVLCETRADVDLYIDQSETLFKNVTMMICDVEPPSMVAANQIVVKLKIEDVFVAIILCRSVAKEMSTDGISPSIKVIRVNIVTFEEEEAKYDAFQLSERPLFRKLTAEANKAMHFFRSIYETGGLRRLIIWLVKFDKLFSTRCAGCSKCMRAEEDGHWEPPFMRDFRDPHSNEFFHLECFPQTDRIY